MPSSPDGTRSFQVIVVGAGVAGLTAAYGLLRGPGSKGVHVQIFEKRSKAQCFEASYPIHLSAAARCSLYAMLCPEDWAALERARKSLPMRHDGLLVMNSAGKRIWHTIREPGEGCMVERAALMDILRRGAGEIEYGRRVVRARNVVGGAEVDLDDGEILKADLVIADGMFSPVRQSLHGVPGIDDVGWTTINLRISASMERFLRDPHGLNVMYSKGWSAAMMPLFTGLYVAVTVPSPVSSPRDALSKLPHCDFLAALLEDPGLREARCFPIYSAIKTLKGKGRVVLIGDAAHGMTPFAASGASAGIHDAWELVKVIRDASELDEGLIAFNVELAKRNDPLIRLSKVVMDLAQGKSRWTRVKRGVGFRVLDVAESILPFRARKEADLCRILAEEAIVAKGMTDSSVSLVTSAPTLVKGL